MKIFLILAGATHSRPLSHTLLSSLLLFLPFLVPVFFVVVVAVVQLFKQIRKSYDGNGDPGYPFRSYYSSNLVNTDTLLLQGSHYTSAK